MGMRNTYRKNYLEYKSKGLCVRCGAIPLSGILHCEKCNNAAKEYAKTSKKKAKSEGLCKWCRGPKSPDRSMCEECLAKHAKNRREKHQQERDKTIFGYGGKCVCCGLTAATYLQLDHINNNGADHRRILTKGKRGGDLYRWAVKNKFPPILQLLCGNCHQAKTRGGKCTPEDHAAMRSII